MTFDQLFTELATLIPQTHVLRVDRWANGAAGKAGAPEWSVIIVNGDDGRIIKAATADMLLATVRLDLENPSALDVGDGPSEVAA